MNLVWSRATQSHFVGKLDVLLFFGWGGEGGLQWMLLVDIISLVAGIYNR